jgi:cytochrome P450
MFWSCPYTQLWGCHSGLLFAEGDAHRKQRKIMNPSFSIGHIRSLMPTFYDKAQIVRDIWMSTIPTASSEKNEKPKGTVNILDTLSRMALDIIGLTGFDYPFDALRNAGKDEAEHGNELAQAFATVLNHPGGFGWWNIIINWFPILYNIVSGSAAVH